MTESQLQSKIIKWLKEQGCYVIKTKPQAGTPVGCPDVIALYNDMWMAVEVKASSTAPFRVGQLATIKRLIANNYFVYVANPDNWEQIKHELATKVFVE